MECPKCGYDRQPEDTHCELCGADFGLLDRQAAEKKQLKSKQKQQAVESVDVLELEESEPESLTDVLPTDLECPKCGAPRREGDEECPQCGVIYKKHEQMLAQKKADAEEKKRQEEQRFLEKKARIQKEAEEGIRREREKRKAAAQKKELAEKKKEELKAITEKITTDVRKKIGESDSVRKIKEAARQKSRKIILAAVLAVVAIVMVWGGYALFSDWQEKSRQAKQLAEQKAAQIRLEEERQQTIQTFRIHRNQVVSHLKSLIKQRKMDQYKAAVKPYDLPELSDALQEVRNYYKEIQLVDKAKWIPAAEFEKNYQVYMELAKLSPGNKTYQKKKQLYQKKLARKNYNKAVTFLSKKHRGRAELADAIKAIQRAIQLEGARKKYKRAEYRLKNAALLFYEGNQNLQMAVRNDGLTKGATGGQRKIYVWLKNVGSTPYFINVDYFTLIGKNKKRYKYNNCSRELIVNLQPGQETGGYLYFYTSSRPAALIFDHINAGKIHRTFP